MTRQRVNLTNITEKNGLDKGLDKEVELLRGVGQMRQGVTALSPDPEGTTINDDIWIDEFIPVGKYLYHRNEEADIYDLFIFIRQELHGGQPFGQGLLTRVDAEIEKELGPWT